MYDVFISYARVDRDLVEPVHRRLLDRGLSVFLDLEGIDGGANFPDVIDRALKCSRAVLCCWTPDYFSRPWCMIECRFAVAADRLVPVRLRVFDDRDVPVDLMGLNYQDLVGWAGDYDDEAWRRVERDLAHKGSASSRETVSQDHLFRAFELFYRDFGPDDLPDLVRPLVGDTLRELPDLRVADWWTWTLGLARRLLDREILRERAFWLRLVEARPELSPRIWAVWALFDPRDAEEIRPASAVRPQDVGEAEPPPVRTRFEVELQASIAVELNPADLAIEIRNRLNLRGLHDVAVRVLEITRLGDALQVIVEITTTAANAVRLLTQTVAQKYSEIFRGVVRGVEPLPAEDGLNPSLDGTRERRTEPHDVSPRAHEAGPLARRQSRPGSVVPPSSPTARSEDPAGPEEPEPGPVDGEDPDAGQATEDLSDDETEEVVMGSAGLSYDAAPTLTSPPPQLPTGTGECTVIAVVRPKTQSGATTTVANLGVILARRGHRTLLVDLDPRGTLSSSFGFPLGTLTYGIYDLLLGEQSLDQVLTDVGIPGLELLAATRELLGADSELAIQPDRAGVLRRLLVALDENRARYDFVLVDCPSGQTMLAVLGLVAADSCLVTCAPEYWHLEGMGELLRTMDNVRAGPNPHLGREGLLICHQDRKSHVHRHVERLLREMFDAGAYLTVIPWDQLAVEAPSFGRAVVEHDPSSVSARAYLDFADEFLDRRISGV